jgi:hypothetical protein
MIGCGYVSGLELKHQLLWVLTLDQLGGAAVNPNSKRNGTARRGVRLAIASSRF